MKPAGHHLLTLGTAVAATLCALLLPVLIEGEPMPAPPLHADPQATLSLITTLYRGA